MFWGSPASAVAIMELKHPTPPVRSRHTISTARYSPTAVDERDTPCDAVVEYGRNYEVYVEFGHLDIAGRSGPQFIGDAKPARIM